MSPSREDGERAVRLTVRAGSPIAEVFLINDDFELVARSVGDLDADVVPGVYKVKSKLGDATAERLVLLDQDETLDVSGDLVVRSPVPIREGTFRRTRGLEFGRARGMQVTSGVGDGAEIFLMTRSGGVSGYPAVNPPLVSLHRLDGTTIGSLAPTAADSSGEDFTTIAVDPGPYFVRRRDSLGDEAEQCVYAVAGWQTQVFTLEEPGDEADIGRTRVSILMGRRRFDPTDPESAIVEEARTALADERKIASEAFGELCETTQDPMLALFGAHLMLIGRDASLREDDRRASGRLDRNAVTAPVQFDQARFDRIVDRLSDVLGPGHADVVALATQRSDQLLEALQPVTAPPMLWRSWVLLIKASNVVPTLVPVSTWQRTLHVLPLRPFFLWVPGEESTEIKESFTRGIAASLAATSPRDAGAEGMRTRSMALPSRAAADYDVRSRLSEELLVPRSAIDSIASGEPV